MREYARIQKEAVMICQLQQTLPVELCDVGTQQASASSADAQTEYSPTEVPCNASVQASVALCHRGVQVNETPGKESFVQLSHAPSVAPCDESVPNATSCLGAVDLSTVLSQIQECECERASVTRRREHSRTPTARSPAAHSSETTLVLCAPLHKKVALS